MKLSENSHSTTNLSKKKEDRIICINAHFCTQRQQSSISFWLRRNLKIKTCFSVCLFFFFFSFHWTQMIWHALTLPCLSLLERILFCIWWECVRKKSILHHHYHFFFRNFRCCQRENTQKKIWNIRNHSTKLLSAVQWLLNSLRM